MAQGYGKVSVDVKTLLIAGFGDIAKRAVASLSTHFLLQAWLRPEHIGQAGKWPAVQCFAGDLDDAATLAALPKDFSHVVHLAPPPVQGTTDARTANLLAALSNTHERLQRFVYISTSGVYGHCDGAWIDESRPVNPQSDRARRRVDAERQIVRFAAAHGLRHVILRVPGIYAADRLPLARLRKGTPVLRAEDDVYTNHVHAEDLVTIITAALTHPAAEGIYNACDDSAMRMGDWFDLIAERTGLPHPPRISRSEAVEKIPAPLLSFMSESRRLDNNRIKTQLGISLRYPSVLAGVPVMR
jgi:nucleoside-diphosphate-sugar epimerase